MLVNVRFSAGFMVMTESHNYSRDFNQKPESTEGFIGPQQVEKRTHTVHFMGNLTIHHSELHTPAGGANSSEDLMGR